MYHFFLEASLNGLAKWLRLLGYSVEVAQGKIMLPLVLDKRENFFIVTSLETAEMLEKVGVNYLILPRENLKSQLRKLIQKLNLSTELKFNLCTLCGVELSRVPKEAYRAQIPKRVYDLYDEFNLCPKCGRLYWEGDHVKRIKEKWEELLS